MFTLPNFVTLLRVLLIPLFLYFLVFTDSALSRLIALLIFIVAALTDFFDGYLARLLGQDSKLGRFLDPLADKILVIAALGVFLYLDPLIPLWMILTIVGRDILITLMRYLAIRKGRELRTTRLAKVKTAFQMISIILILIIFIIQASSYLKAATGDMKEVPYYLMLATTIITIISGLRYVIENFFVFIPPWTAQTDGDNTSENSK